MTWSKVTGIQKPNLFVRDLQQLQHNRMSSHVPQKPLLLLTAFPDWGTFLNAELAEPQQDLEKRLDLEPRFWVIFQSTSGGCYRSATLKNTSAWTRMALGNKITFWALKKREGDMWGQKTVTASTAPLSISHHSPHHPFRDTATITALRHPARAKEAVHWPGHHPWHLWPGLVLHNSATSSEPSTQLHSTEPQKDQ